MQNPWYKKNPSCPEYNKAVQWFQITYEIKAKIRCKIVLKKSSKKPVTINLFTKINVMGLPTFKNY